MFHSAWPASSKPAASRTRGSGDSSASIASMRSISAVWSDVTSEVNAKSCESCAAPRCSRRFSTMVRAPRWCLIISSRNSRSNAPPRAAASRSISSPVSMPGIGCQPGAWCASSAGTACPRARSHSRIIAISSSWESSMRCASRRIAPPPVRVSRSAVISSAWAWWEIMPCMNFTSASVNRMPARLEASAAETTRLGWPGAPGWTIGGCARLSSAPIDRSARPTPPVAADSG